MPPITVADLIALHVPLTSREAATLTLAVANEWDRQRSIRGPIALPPLTAIQLDPSGRVAFLVTPSISDADPASTLSNLLSRLVGLDEDGRTRASAPDELLVSMTGRPRRTMRPPHTTEEFRTALARFADSDSEVLRLVVARARSGGYPDRRRTAAASRRVERRRHPPALVAGLRHELRAHERRAFEARRRRRTMLQAFVVGTVFVAAAAIVSIVRLDTTSNQAAPIEATHGETPSAVPADDVRHARAVIETPSVSLEPPPGRRAEATSETHVPRHARRQHPPTHQSAHQFAGGTRGIAWLAAR